MTKTFIGKVIKTNKMRQTITVGIESRRPHPLYKKMIKKNKKILTHLEKGEVKEGDLVKISQTKPISKKKHFKFIEVVK